MSIISVKHHHLLVNNILWDTFWSLFFLFLLDYFNRVKMTSPKPHIKPSSGSDGFIQAAPKVRNQFQEDVTLRRIADCKTTHHPQNPEKHTGITKLTPTNQSTSPPPTPPP
jgi:hypothetical protein